MGNDASATVFKSVTVDASAKRTTIVQLLLIFRFKCNMAIAQIVNLVFCLMAITDYPLELSMPNFMQRYFINTETNSVLFIRK